jgi:hypothetical protein
VRITGGFGAGLVVAWIAVVAAGCGRSALLDLGGPGDDGGVDLNPDGSAQGDAPVRTIPVTCGNGTCDPGENCDNCSEDCGLCPSCGDGKCEASSGETCESCPQDCGVCATCGDGYCNGNETCETCAPDCGVCKSCGDGTCSPPEEDCFTCPEDCGKCAGCGDGTCTPPETCASCPMDCGVCAVCGNGVCEKPYETCVNCPADCGACTPISCLEELGCAEKCLMPLNVTCVADCVAEGCAQAGYLVNQVIDCFIMNAGACGGLNISCLTQKCQSSIAACIGNHC